MKSSGNSELWGIFIFALTRPDKAQHDKNCGFHQSFNVLVHVPTKHLLDLNETGVLHHLAYCTQKHKRGMRQRLRVNICTTEMGGGAVTMVSHLCFHSLALANTNNSLEPENKHEHFVTTIPLQPQMNKCQVIRISSCGEGWSVTVAHAQMGKPTTRNRSSYKTLSFKIQRDIGSFEGLGILISTVRHQEWKDEESLSVIRLIICNPHTSFFNVWKMSHGNWTSFSLGQNIDIEVRYRTTLTIPIKVGLWLLPSWWMCKVSLNFLGMDKRAAWWIGGRNEKVLPLNLSVRMFHCPSAGWGCCIVKGPHRISTPH